jgi:MATE family multidrug resistance protein
MLGVGVPTSGSLLFEGGAFAAATVMMGWLGAAPLAAHQIAISCAALTFMVALGLSMAVGMRMSAAVGAGAHGSLRPIWAGGVLMGLVMSLAVTVAFLTLGHPIASCFIRDEGVESIATILLVVAAVFQIFDGSQVINSAALRALTDVKVPAAMTFVAYWLVALPTGYLLGIRGPFGPAGIWSGLAAGLALAAVLLGLRLHRLTDAVRLRVAWAPAR